MPSSFKFEICLGCNFETPPIPDWQQEGYLLVVLVYSEKAGIAPLLDVEDMVIMRKPDWKCVFTYVQSVYRRFKDQD
jgi:hypothetical protein